MNKYYLLLLLSTFFASTAFSQILTREDSLAAGLVTGTQKTIISGYGEARMSVDMKQKNGEATLERAVLFVGHKFTNRIALFTEMEIEDAMIVGGVSENGEERGEIAMEQVFLKFDLNPNTYLSAGLIIPRIGIINENHLPTTFNGVGRPMVEQLIIPSTWRGIGIGLYGMTPSIPGLNYSLFVSNGLNSGNFENGSGIKEGRQQGAKATGLGLLVSGSLLYYRGRFRVQFSSTVSGSTATEKRIADSLHLNSGVLANSVFLNEMNVQYRGNGLEMKALACMINIPDAANINATYANNTPTRMLGAYAEAGYDVLYARKKENYKALILFARAEYIDLNQQIAENGIANDANKKMYLLGGITFKPIRGVAVKCDYTQRMTGAQNDALIVTPFPQLTPYYRSKGFINAGIVYNF